MRPDRTGRGGFDGAYVDLFARAQRCALRVLGDRADAEDVAAETMARAFAHWSKVSSYAPAWVARVAANLAADRLRRKPPQIPERVRPTEGVDRLVIREELAKLPRRQREAIVLRYLVGLDEQETAAALGVGVATVHTHVKRGLARMRHELDETGFGVDQR